jgi:hypothetical protein
MYTSPLITQGFDNVVISSSVENFDLAPYARGSALHANIFIESGVRVGSNDPSIPALRCTTSINANNSVCNIFVAGEIWGSNGAGADGGTGPGVNGGKGGTAIKIPGTLYIHTEFGTIKGGGGGGGSADGGGGFTYGGSGGGNPGGYIFDVGIYAETSQYGVAAGSTGSPARTGGTCNGVGTTGDPATPSGGSGGSVGNAVDSDGGTTIVVVGGGNIAGGIV